MDRLGKRIPSALPLAASALALGLTTAAQTPAASAAGTATTPTVTTPASAKIGQPTTIAPTATQTAPGSAAPGATAPSANTPATTAPAATTPASTAPAATTPATAAPAATAPAAPATPTTALPRTGATPANPSAAAGLLARGQRIPPARRSKGISTEAIVLAALAGLLLLACGAWAFARSRAYEPHWMLSLRHAMSEAGFRLSATWAEFTDWVRLGR